MSKYHYSANKCYYLEEEEFVDLLIKRYEEKKKYADYLEKEGSIMAQSFRERENVFKFRDTGPEGSPIKPPNNQ